MNIDRIISDEVYEAGENANLPSAINPFVTLAQLGPVSGLISGGVSYSGIGFTYDVSALVYKIQGTLYAAAATSVTLTAADPTFDRIDVIYADNTGSVGFITGTPAASPVKPTVDAATQLELTFVTVPAGAAGPGITVEDVYLENAGTPTEWAPTAVGFSPNFAATADPHTGTFHIDTNAAFSANDAMIFTPAAPYTITDSVVSFWINPQASMSAPLSGFSVGFYVGSSLVGNSVQIGGVPFISYGFDPLGPLGVYQLVTIPISAFGSLPTTVDSLRMTKPAGPPAITDCYLDDITIQEVILPPTGLKMDDLADVTLDFDTDSSVQDDDGKYVFWDEPSKSFITDPAVTHGTIIINSKTSGGTGSIAKGLPVYIDGFDSDLHVVELADADGAGTNPCIGFTAEPLNDTDSKHVITFGKLTGVDTQTTTGTTLNPNGETWLVGYSLYLSTTPGGLTSTRPTGTAQIQRIAKVLKVDTTGGQLFIFNTARNADLPNLANGKIWQGNASGYPVEVDPPSGSTGPRVISWSFNGIYSNSSTSFASIPEQIQVPTAAELGGTSIQAILIVSYNTTGASTGEFRLFNYTDSLVEGFLTAVPSGTWVKGTSAQAAITEGKAYRVQSRRVGGIGSDSMQLESATLILIVS